jgi:hypothetical protein
MEVSIEKWSHKKSSFHTKKTEMLVFDDRFIAWEMRRAVVTHPRIWHKF